MLSLARLVYSILAPTLAGVGVVVFLVMGFGTLAPLLGGAVLGALLALPLSWIIARALY